MSANMMSWCIDALQRVVLTTLNNIQLYMHVIADFSYLVMRRSWCTFAVIENFRVHVCRFDFKIIR